MSTNQHWNAPTSPTAEAERHRAEQQPAKDKKLDLSVTKVLGGALAAMTAAALGSRLSVAGTLVGAALASVIAAVAGSLYTASLSHTRDKVRTVWTGRAGGGETPTQLQTSNQVEAGLTAAPARATAPRPTTPTTIQPPGHRRALPWKSILAATLSTFALAAVLLTGFELVTGHALSGGSGTTIGEVGSGNTNPKPKPTSQPTKTATPSATPSSSATTSSTPSAPASQPDLTPSSEPSATPSSPTPSVTPTPGDGGVSTGQGGAPVGGQ